MFVTDKIYVKVLKDKKIPVEKEWQTNPRTKKELQLWVSNGGNRGILYSKPTGLCCIDIDNPDKFPLSSLIQNPDTTTVKTSRGDRKSTRLNSSHIPLARMPSSA